MRISDWSSDVCSSDLFARLLGSKTAAQTDDEDCSKLLLGSELEQAMAQDAQIPSETLHSSGRRSSGPSGVLRRLESRVQMTRPQNSPLTSAENKKGAGNRRTSAITRYREGEGRRKS